MKLEQNKLAAALRKAAGVPAGTSIDDALDALEAKQAARRTRDAARLAAAIQLPAAPPATLRSNGVRLLSRDEAAEALLFGAATAHARKRVEATEDYFGKPLAECIRGGDL